MQNLKKIYYLDKKLHYVSVVTLNDSLISIELFTIPATSK